jgi:inosose dehydratase
MVKDLGPLQGRVAGAPISWGVCEVPGWGKMLSSSRVLSEMRSLGLTATELGAPGFLPAEPEALRAELGSYDLRLIGGFVPLVLHDPARRTDALRRARATAELFQGCGATRFVTAVVQDYDWSRPVPLDADGMKRMASGLAAVDDVCATHGLTQVLHPHVNTLVETKADVELALEHSTVLWCLDTGHLRIGGVDPVEFARSEAHRVGHVHLKDVHTQMAAKVLSREVSLLKGVQQDLFRPLGTGDVAVDEVVASLEARGYAGWYVLEQDTALTNGVPPEGTGPVEEVMRSLTFLTDRITPRLVAAQGG